MPRVDVARGSTKSNSFNACFADLGAGFLLALILIVAGVFGTAVDFGVADDFDFGTCLGVFLSLFD
eukprot:m.70760 g.70760  ORF g.70760 m.70760 type:complete len:66 (+) comp12162_c1_seq1:178-375(+)